MLFNPDEGACSGGAKGRGSGAVTALAMPNNHRRWAEVRRPPDGSLPTTIPINNYRRMEEEMMRKGRNERKP